MLTYNVILNTVPEAGSWGSLWMYTGLKAAAASSTVLRIILYFCVCSIGLPLFEERHKIKRAQMENSVSYDIL